MTTFPTSVDQSQLSSWVDQFHRDGYLFLENVLTPEHCAELRADLDRMLAGDEGGTKHITPTQSIVMRAFEWSPANVRLFDLDPIAAFAEALVAPDCHVVHNNSFTTPHGGGLSTWHQDDAPHYLVTEGAPPTNVRLPVLFFTANYYLTDVTEIEHGCTEVIPGSHLFGAPSPEVMAGTKWEPQIKYNLGQAGSVVLFNNQVWHRGGPNTSDRTRYITQVTYGRRMIGHKYYPFMNYQMPERCLSRCEPAPQTTARISSARRVWLIYVAAGSAEGWAGRLVVAGVVDPGQGLLASARPATAERDQAQLNPSTRLRS